MEKISFLRLNDFESQNKCLIRDSETISNENAYFLYFFCLEFFWNFLWSTNGILTTNQKFLAEKKYLVQKLFLDPLNQYLSVLRASVATSMQNFSSIKGQEGIFS